MSLMGCESKVSDGKKVLAEAVEKSLRGSALWDEVKDRLNDNALGLSGGQQQRLCIARTIAVQPKIILMDEPCSALDPIATAKVEELMNELRKDFTIVIVTHSMQQASRISDNTAFLLPGGTYRIRQNSRYFCQPERTTDRGLHQWPIWVRGGIHHRY